MTLTITGATGHLGRHVVETLLARGVAPEEIVATGRDTDRLADLGARGVQVRRADFDDPSTLAAAFEGTDRLLLVSASEVGRRIPQHRAAITAAEQAGVQLVAYTSISHATTSQMLLAHEHRATEEALAESAVPHAILRHSWYLENYTGQVATALQHGIVLGAAGEGRVSAALRDDFAEAAAAVLATDGHAGAVYELGGDGFTLAEFAAAISGASGQSVAYKELPEAELTAALVAAGLPEGYAAALADADRGIARGDLFTDSGDLGRLLGRPPVSMQEAVTAAVEALRS